jgi:regulator of protease activity HflC (stomatin/prohibitin superfamily)
MIREKSTPTIPGLFSLIALLVALAVGAVALVLAFASGSALFILPAIAWFVFTLISFHGLFIVNPNQAQVLQLFGQYVGSVRDDGFHFTNPFYSRQPMSLRVRNFESNHLKVNDHDENPIEIAAIVVWRVVDTAEALFEVDDYVQYVRVQTEAAVRNLATLHPYDAHEEHQLSLRGNTTEIAGHLKEEVQQRLAKAGVEVLEARISHFAYAPEIAAAMLRRQQASAIIAARQKIVEGAVTMVQMAIDHLTEKNIVNLNDESKAALVNNLMVVLCSDHNAQPIVNTGSPQATAPTAAPPETE